MFLRRQSSWNASSNQADHQLVGINQVLDRARNGEAEALSTLYHHFLPGIFGYIAARTADRSTAEDLTSEVFLKMVEGIHKVRATNEASFAAWLLQVARITVADYYRKRAKQPPLVSLDTTLWEDSTLSHSCETITASDPTHDPVQWSEAREEWSTVVEAINMLTEEQRQVLPSRLILGYDVATVAQMLGKKANAVKALQFRALQSLERLLAKSAQPEKQLSYAREQGEA